MSLAVRDSVKPLAFLRGVVESAGHSCLLTCRYRGDEEVDVTLRITRGEGPLNRATLKLEGSVIAEWATLLERECFDLLRTFGNVSLDLASVVFVDRAGIAALVRLSRAGVEVRCRTGLLASVLEEEGVLVTRNADGGDPRGN